MLRERPVLPKTEPLVLEDAGVLTLTFAGGSTVAPCALRQVPVPG